MAQKAKSEPQKGVRGKSSLHPGAALGGCELPVIWGREAPVEEMIQKEGGMR